MIFILCIGYLTFIGWKVSIFKKNPRAFIKQFWFQWLLFGILLTVQLTIPPMPCYFNNDGSIVLLVGFILLGFVALTSIMMNDHRFIRFYAKHFEKDYFVSPTITVNEFITIGVEPQQYPPETIKASIRSIKYTSNSKGIKIVSVQLREMKNDFVGTLE